jgi:polysaccharide deacetylase 2 family uncharacterized protein YibQ
VSRGGVKVELRGVGKMRGSTKGSLWALALGGVGLSFASLVATPPMQGDAPITPQLQVPQPIFAAPAPVGLALLAPESENNLAQTGPQFPLPALQDTGPVVDTTPALAPEDLQAVAEVEIPQEQPAEPVAVVKEQSAPTRAIVEQIIVADEVLDPPDPIVTSQSDSTESETAMADAAISEGDTMTADRPEQPESDVVVVLPTEAEEEVAVPLVSTTQPEATAAPLIVQAPVAADVGTDEVAQEPETSIELPAQEEPALAPEETPIVADQDETPAETDEIEVAEAPTEPARSGPVRVNRIGAAPSGESAGEEAAIVEAEEAVEDLPALRQFAAPFENTEDLPLMSLVLVDNGTVAGAAAEIAALDFAPTIVIDALAVDAADKMAEYRAAGLEVAMQISLPDGAQPTDVEVAFAAAFDVLPEAVLLFSDGTGLLQGNRNVTTQAMAVLAAEGRGFVAVQRGLGSAVRDAEDAGVPAAIVARRIDGNGAAQNAIVRALDQAAFRARQSGGAVLAGTVTPDTLAALREWAGTVDRDQLLIAPASALLLAQSK